MKLFAPRSLLGLALSFAVAGALATIAVADDQDDTRRNIFQKVTMFEGSSRDAISRAWYDDLRADPADCRALIVAGTAAGIKPTDTYDDGTTTYLWKRVGAICDRYQQLFNAAPAARIAEDAVRSYGVYASSLDPTSTGTITPGNPAQAKACVEAIDQAVARGVPADFVMRMPYPLGEDNRGSLADARKLCVAYGEFTGKASAIRHDREAAAEKAVSDKYTRHGITGDRLKYLMDADNRFVMGKGCKTLEMAGKKKSAVLYEMQEGDTYWVVYKMQFKGDKLIRTSEKRFNKATSNGWTCT